MSTFAAKSSELTPLVFRGERAMVNEYNNPNTLTVNFERLFSRGNETKQSFYEKHWWNQTQLNEALGSRFKVDKGCTGYVDKTNLIRQVVFSKKKDNFVVRSLCLLNCFKLELEPDYEDDTREYLWGYLQGDRSR